MKLKFRNLLIISFLIVCISCSSRPISPFWEIPDPSLPEIAMIRVERGDLRTVVYNPVTCQEIGEACGFFRLHAYSHEILRHSILGEPDDYPPSQEAAADCYAAKYGKPNEVYAVVQLFLDENRNPDWRIHGNPIERAANIRNCAIKSENWIGD